MIVGVDDRCYSPSTVVGRFREIFFSLYDFGLCRRDCLLDRNRALARGCRSKRFCQVVNVKIGSRLEGAGPNVLV